MKLVDPNRQIRLWLRDTENRRTLVEISREDGRERTYSNETEICNCIDKMAGHLGKDWRWVLRQLDDGRHVTGSFFILHWAG